MNTRHARQNWFPCFSPDRVVTRAEAVSLIRKHAASGAPRLALFADLTDTQIRDHLPTAWLREHQQADMFRDATAAVANDAQFSLKKTFLGLLA